MGGLGPAQILHETRQKRPDLTDCGRTRWNVTIANSTILGLNSTLRTLWLALKPPDLS